MYEANPISTPAYPSSISRDQAFSVSERAPRDLDIASLDSSSSASLSLYNRRRRAQLLHNPSILPPTSYLPSRNPRHEESKSSLPHLLTTKIQPRYSRVSLLCRQQTIPSTTTASLPSNTLNPQPQSRKLYNLLSTTPLRNHTVPYHTVPYHTVRWHVSILA